MVHNPLSRSGSCDKRPFKDAKHDALGPHNSVTASSLFSISLIEMYTKDVELLERIWKFSLKGFYNRAPWCIHRTHPSVARWGQLPTLNVPSIWHVIKKLYSHKSEKKKNTPEARIDKNKKRLRVENGLKTKTFSEKFKLNQSRSTVMIGEKPHKKEQPAPNISKRLWNPFL